MKNSDFILINKQVLPDHFAKVLAVKDLIGNGENVTTACKKVGLSRSAYYKYKDDVFPASSVDRRFIIIVKLAYSSDVLITFLNFLSTFSVKIYALNQEIPVNNVLFLNLTLAITDQTTTPFDLIDSIAKLNYVKNVKLLGIE